MGVHTCCSCGTLSHIYPSLRGARIGKASGAMTQPPARPMGTQLHGLYRIATHKSWLARCSDPISPNLYDSRGSERRLLVGPPFHEGGLTAYPDR
ncbi:hypothetical protein VTK73DRAFT_2818 [Phialemonium thermophilum]|uniref:Uncharacterized protein n=1 Tax=Phialemonium thermophilum TaxID=223376 RepID=A0ABR3X255_9PEZI